MGIYTALTTSIRYVIFGALLCTPALISPWFTNTDMVKWIAFLSIAILMLFYWAISTIKKKTVVLTYSWELVGIGSIVLTQALTLLFTTSQRIDHITAPFGILTWSAMAIFLLFGNTILSEKEKILLRLGLCIEATLLAIIAIYQSIGISTLLFPSLSWLHTPLWTPIGSPAGLLAFLGVIVPIPIAIAYRAIQDKKETIATLAVISSILLIIGFGVTIIRFFPTIPSTLLPLPLGYTFMKASWDSLPHALVGQGAASFLSIFTTYRPQSINMTPLWSTAFTVNASMFLHIGTTTGLLGIISMLLFIIFLIVSWFHHPITRIQSFIIACILLCAPPSFSFLISITLLMLTTPSRVYKNSIHLPVAISIGCIICALASLAVVGIATLAKGEYAYKYALTMGERGNGAKTYEYLTQAIQANPQNTAYHIALSQTYISLAQSILSQATIKEDGSLKLSEEDQSFLTELISHAIKEGKIGVTLSPKSVQAWANLAHIYQGLMGIAKDADVWAVASYQKAIELDPTNPVLRLDYGGLFMKLERYDEAGQQFLSSITLKPNYINGFYNMAHVFSEKGDYDNAIKTLEQTKQLIAKGSDEDQKIDEEIILFTKEKSAKGQSKQPVTLPVPQLTLP